MTTPPIRLERILEVIETYKSTLVPAELRDDIRLTSRYELFDGPHGEAHWPKVYGEVWGNLGSSGVYMHFDAADDLKYVGKAVSIGGRFGSYFGFGEQRKCKIKDDALKDVVGVRAVILEGVPLKFLTPSLEWYLIDQLAPPVNKQHKKQEWISS